MEEVSAIIISIVLFALFSAAIHLLQPLSNEIERKNRNLNLSQRDYLGFDEAYRLFDIQNYPLPLFSEALTIIAGFLHVEPGYLRPDDNLQALNFKSWIGLATDVEVICDELLDLSASSKNFKKYDTVVIATVRDAVMEALTSIGLRTAGRL